MANLLCCRVIWNRSAPPMPSIRWREGDRLHPAKFMPLYVDPEPDYPGGRKGYILTRAWQQLQNKADGMLLLDGDVAIDPFILAQMMQAIDSDCTRVWTAAARIWPVATHRQEWVWASWEEKASQELDEFPKWFSFCFTYLPRSLVEGAIKAGLSKWQYPRVDANMSRTAQRLNIKAQVVAECYPVHMNWG